MEQLGTKVYIASTKAVEEEQRFQALYQRVPKGRQEKIDRLRHVKDKRLSLAAALLLGEALRLNGIHDYEILIDENGKPYLAGNEIIKFNLSHSKERVMCVLSDKEVGCDVEYKKEYNNKLAKRFLAEEELALFHGRNGEEEKRDIFYRLWTLKESFVKAVGQGMRISLKKIQFSFHENQAQVYQNVNGESFYFKEYDLKDGYRYAVCSRNPDISEIIPVQLDSVNV